MSAPSNPKTLLAEALLADLPPSGAGAEHRFRDAARARLLASGAPVRRDEYWRYTDPARLTKPMPPLAATDSAPALAAAPFGEVAAPRLVFVNGRFRADLSDAVALEGLEIAPLSRALAEDGWAARALGRLETRGQSPVARPLAALNGAAFTDGLAIRVTRPVATPIHIHAEGLGEGAGYLRHVLELAEGAALTLLESGAAGMRGNIVLEADLAAGAALHHVRVQDGATPETATALFAAVGRGGALQSFTLTAGAGSALTRNEAVLWIDGDDANAHIAGAALGGGDSHVDNTVFLTHGALNGVSRQVYKHVLAERARAVFQGKILVKPGAQKTDGYQISQAVLLDGAAEFDAKPELEIYADDVKCSHGSTTGAFDESLMFYLRSRGLDPHRARTMLVAAFVEDAILEIESPGLREAMRMAAARWMASRAA